MAAQILLQGRLTGIDAFLLSRPSSHDNRVFEARLQWVTILGEVLPRALLAHLQLPSLLLGASGSANFLVILPDQARADEANSFLERAAGVLKTATAGLVGISWSATENLGDWTVVRKRLADGLRDQATQALSAEGFFEPYTPAGMAEDLIPRGLRDAAAVGFSLDLPALIAAEGGDHRWDIGLSGSLESIPVSRHAARNGDAPASARELAKRAKGRKMWGILRGQIDGFATRLRRAQGAEEYVQLSVMYKQFLAGEIELLCSQGDFFQRVTVLRTGSADFELAGSWDALANFARELQRVISVFARDVLKELVGAEGKTITMSLTTAEPGDAFASAWESSQRDLAIAQASDKDCFRLLGRVLEWKQLNDAAELRDTVIQLDDEFRGGAQFLAQLRTLYRKVETSSGNAAPGEQDRLAARAMRFQRRFAGVANRREREFQKLKSHLMKEVAGRNMRGRLRLRPEGLVALEWARLANE